MKNLFHQEAAQEILQRIEKLTPESQALWGKMDVAQMLTHCGQVIKVPLQKITLAKPPFAFRMVFKLLKAYFITTNPGSKVFPQHGSLLYPTHRILAKLKTSWCL